MNNLGTHSFDAFFVPLTKYDNDVLFWDGWCPSETLLPPTSYKWFSKWFQLLGQSGGRVQSTIADTIAILQIHSEKFNICSCQGIVKSRPHKICWTIFSYFWHFMWGVWGWEASLHTRFISIQSLTGCHISNVFMSQLCLWRKYSLINQKYFLLWP